MPYIHSHRDSRHDFYRKDAYPIVVSGACCISNGRFAEAKEILNKHDVEKDKWIVEAMMTHIDALDPEPFLLVKDGKRLF